LTEKIAQNTAMQIDIITEFGAWSKLPGLESLIRTAALAAVNGCGEDFRDRVELSVLLTSDEAIRQLNSTYRGHDRPTNVLSFPGELDTRSPGRPFLLGDIVLGYQTIAAEAQQQHKNIENHVSHLIVHGVLHLLGHDHENDKTACDMEFMEINILKGIGVENPYSHED